MCKEGDERQNETKIKGFISFLSKQKLLPCFWSYPVLSTDSPIRIIVIIVLQYTSAKPQKMRSLDFNNVFIQLSFWDKALDSTWNKLMFWYDLFIIVVKM